MVCLLVVVDYKESNSFCFMVSMYFFKINTSSSYILSVISWISTITLDGHSLSSVLKKEDTIIPGQPPHQSADPVKIG